MSPEKNLDDSPPVGSNATGTPGDEKLEYDEEIGEKTSGRSETSNKDEPVDKESGDSSRSRRIKVTIQRPEALEELAKKLGSSKAGVYNTALGMLAEQMGVDSA